MPNYVSTLTGQQINDVMTQIDQGVPEGWAVGEKNGVPVSSSSPYYHNNAKYYAENALDSANRAEAAVPAGTAGAVFFDRAQTLTTAQQEQARQNIKAGGSNRNLLDNPWWGSAEVVNQRGETSGAFNGQIHIDRWYFRYNEAAGSFSLGANGMTVTAPSSPNTSIQRLCQSIENYTALYGKTLTVSIMFGDGSIETDTLVRSTTGGTQYFNFPTNGLSGRFLYNQVIEFFVGVGLTKTIRAVKLELGSVSTLANDAPPNYADELAKCKYYFERISAPDGNLTLGVGCVGQQLDRVYAPIKIAPKRAKPTITMTGSPRLGKYTFVDSYGLTVTALSWTAFDPKTGLGTLTAQIASASMVQSDFYRLGLMQGNTIDISADL